MNGIMTVFLIASLLPLSPYPQDVSDNNRTFCLSEKGFADSGLSNALDNDGQCNTMQSCNQVQAVETT